MDTYGMYGGSGYDPTMQGYDPTMQGYDPSMMGFNPMMQQQQSLQLGEFISNQIAEGINRMTSGNQAMIMQQQQMLMQPEYARQQMREYEMMQREYEKMMNPKFSQMIMYLNDFLYQRTGMSAQRPVYIDDTPEYMRHCCSQKGISHLAKNTFKYGNSELTYYFCTGCGRLYVYGELTGGMY